MENIHTAVANHLSLLLITALRLGCELVVLFFLGGAVGRRHQEGCYPLGRLQFPSSSQNLREVPKNHYQHLPRPPPLQSAQHACVDVLEVSNGTHDACLDEEDGFYTGSDHPMSIKKAI